MQRFSSHLNGFAACEEVCNAAIPPPSMYRRRPPVVCPKPRRVSCWTASDVAVDLRSLPCTDRQTGCAAELADSAIGDELLEIFLKKDAYGEQEEEEEHQAWSLISSSPPYFCGSPPRRASNPLVHDPNFLQGKLNDTSLTQSPFEEYTHYTTTTTTVATHKYQPPSAAGQPAASGCFPVATATPAGSARRASCLRSSDNFGPNPAMVRVEGFDCFNRRGGRGCSISAFA